MAPFMNGLYAGLSQAKTDLVDMAFGEATIIDLYAGLPALLAFTGRLGQGAVKAVGPKDRRYAEIAGDHSN